MNKCISDGLVYTSNPPQSKCINCGRMWFQNKGIPDCIVNSRLTEPLLSSAPQTWEERFDAIQNKSHYTDEIKTAQEEVVREIYNMKEIHMGDGAWVYQGDIIKIAEKYGLNISDKKE